MRFRLVYYGELRSSQRRRPEADASTLAEHKHAIRKVMHRQLAHLWKIDRFLSECRVYAESYGANQSASDNRARWGISDDKRISLVEALARKLDNFGYRFVPLIRKEWHLTCKLDMIFLRYAPPGCVIHAGDLDDRIKTLIDGLRMPENLNELRGNEAPSTDEEPFYCLLEDDSLVAGFSVDSDQLLEPPSGTTDLARRQAHVVITVDVGTSYPTQFNSSFI